MKRSGFTLVEMAMVLIIMGIIVGSSSKVFTSLSKNSKIQESRELLKEISLDIEGFSRTFHRLPKLKELIAFRMQTKDSWGKEIIYLPSKELTESMCDKSTTSLEHRQNEKVVKNLAFILVSSGANRNLQTSIHRDDITVVQTAFRSEKVDFDRDKINRVEPYDDFYLTRTLWSLKAQIQCSNKGSL